MLERIDRTEFYQLIINYLANAPDSHLSKILRTECEKYVSGRNEGELYDFIVGVSKQPPTEISSFVRELCSLDKYREYERPKN